ncbi:hypothetical protein Q8W15_02355 [Photobacterium damselae subsp. piscicida]|uniref:Uncharacterized protein n=1 Tax=Photobacterium damsela subsp. piscicida TaxID=38294 RepID=A0A7L8A8A9_PHODP|nr:hypothetical protein [Photobacterium damselae]MBE8127564.1 hypothetical protein [Photobacterium damselae subsp. piscicida]MDP2531141.1 hypothetical protein [Photobacterium damselae subsp. piscicida]MDP2556494.1 hypothetical protein [Photobacterium damselae subsp. piscicida]MDP2567615.1 hypothetical protein [Photobacterium damselae subsp. piscicida]QOD54622.1 hypothetical protein IC628_16345 [Photobacterium damselae subsp. piscicida]
MKVRPSAYNTHHTFVDELIVAQLVGNTHSSMTFGRYGKNHSIQKLASTKENVRFPR